MSDQTTSDPDLVERLRTAFAAHPILKGQKKLKVSGGRGVVRVEGTVFTRDMLRQVDETVLRVAHGEDVRIAVSSEVRAPRARKVHGQVPETSPGGVSMNPTYSTKHIEGEGSEDDEDA